MKIRVNQKKFSLFLLFVLTIYIGIMHFQATVDSINIENDQEKYLALIQEEQSKNDLLKEKEKSLNTVESYETIARENLGLLKADEMLFINAHAN